MSEVSDEAVQQFMELAQVDEPQARFLLEAAGGDTDGALQLLFDQAPAAVQPRPAPPQPPIAPLPRHERLPPRPPAPVSAAGSAQGPPQAPAPPARRRLFPFVLGTAIGLPFLVLRTGLSLTTASIALGIGVTAFLGDRFLPAPVMRTVRGVVATLTGGNELDALGQANKFINDYKAAYGDIHPNFVPLDLQSACVAARGEHRFLFVYLHSPEHEDTSQFCREVLSNLDLIAYANSQYVCWGGDIRQSDAHALSMRLGATTYPFVAVLSMAHNTNKATLLKASQGTNLLVPGVLLHMLQQCVEEQGPLLVAQRAEVSEREVTRRLLAEQNAEYEASLAADREREQRRQAEQQERERQEQEERARVERERAAQEEAERRRRDKITRIQTRREAKLRLLPPEAEPGLGSAVVRVRLPDGSNAQRCFAASCTVANIFDFVDSLESTNYWKYSLVSNFPRKVFTQADDGMQRTLTDAGLAPHAALFVQPDDEEDEPAAAT